MDKTTYFLSISRLAPIQAAWWGGNADTSGARTMNYRLVSEYEHDNYEEHYSEKTFQIKYVSCLLSSWLLGTNPRTNFHFSHEQ